MGYILLNLPRFIDIVGEEQAKSVLSDFSCPRNKDIELFLRKKAFEFCKQRLATTHLAFTIEQDAMLLVGYFALANKTITVLNAKEQNSKMRRNLKKFGVYDQENDRYDVPAPLIAQFGKNYTNGHNERISGDELLKMACDTIESAQRILSGKFAYLECEDAPKLKAFYNKNGFYEYGSRPLDPEERGTMNGTHLVQMLKYFDRAEGSKPLTSSK